MAGTITSLVVQKKNKERVNVFLDGKFAFGLAMIEALKLHKGQTLSDEDIARLAALDEIERAHERALNYLAYRPRSTAEVTRKLEEHDISAPATEAVVARLTRAGLLNDESFARFWIDNRQHFKPRGSRALRYELRQKGVADEIIDRMLESTDEEAAAYAAGASRLSRYAGADRQTFSKKLGDHLARRGFSYDIIRDVLDRLWNESQDTLSGHKYGEPDTT